MNRFLKTLLATTSLFIASQAMAQPAIDRIDDHIAIKNLVDTFSTLADDKRIDEQVLLFTENAEVTSFTGKTKVSELKGRTELATRFKAFLDNFHTVYHHNGQLTLTFTDPNNAKGVNYSQVYLVANKDGKDIMRASSVRYNDEYVKVNGKWLINKRESYFMINDVRELGTQN